MPEPDAAGAGGWREPLEFDTMGSCRHGGKKEGGREPFLVGASFQLAHAFDKMKSRRHA